MQDRMDHHKSLKVVDLFAGCGGLSLGLEEAGFFPVFVNELNDDARETYIRNREGINPLLRDPGFHSSDVKSMLTSKSYVRGLERRLKDAFGMEHGELDLLVGGPPCQGYSGIGHRRSYSVDKERLPSNHLFQDMAELVRRLEPRAFLFENVRGLLNARWTEGGEKGEIWSQVVATFEGIKNYKVAHRLVFAKDYGVPQNRPRVLLVGIHKDVRSSLLTDVDSMDAVERGYLPAGGVVRPPDPFELLGDLIDPAFENGMKATQVYPRPARTKIQKMLRTPRNAEVACRKGEPVSEHEYSKHAPRIVDKFERMIATGKVPAEHQTKKFAQRVLPRKWNGEGPTITATSLPDDYVHFEQPRILTVREWARLQMFPDWYQFAGKRSTGGLRRAGNPREGVFDREVPKYTQIGNAVPVGLAKALGEHLAKVLAK